MCIHHSLHKTKALSGTIIFRILVQKHGGCSELRPCMYFAPFKRANFFVFCINALFLFLRLNLTEFCLSEREMRIIMDDGD